MSAASPAQSQVRRNAAAAPSRSPQQAPQQQAAAPARQAANSHAFDFTTPKGEEEIRLNLSDIPVMRGTLDVEGLTPSLLSRLFDLIAPLDRR
jgi:hypothetical protein